MPTKNDVLPLDAAVEEPPEESGEESDEAVIDIEDPTVLEQLQAKIAAQSDDLDEEYVEPAPKVKAGTKRIRCKAVHTGHQLQCQRAFHGVEDAVKGRHRYESQDGDGPALLTWE